MGAAGASASSSRTTWSDCGKPTNTKIPRLNRPVIRRLCPISASKGYGGPCRTKRASCGQSVLSQTSGNGPCSTKPTLSALPSEQQPSVWGSLCIDCKSTNVFDEIHAPELGAAIADALFTILQASKMQIASTRAGALMHSPALDAPAAFRQWPWRNACAVAKLPPSKRRGHQMTFSSHGDPEARPRDDVNESRLHRDRRDAARRMDCAHLGSRTLRAIETLFHSCGGRVYLAPDCCLSAAPQGSCRVSLSREAVSQASKTPTTSPISQRGLSRLRPSRA